MKCSMSMPYNKALISIHANQDEWIKDAGTFLRTGLLQLVSVFGNYSGWQSLLFACSKQRLFQRLPTCPI